MTFIFDDGGRARAGFKGSTSDCVTRAIAIAAECDYLWVYEQVAYANSMNLDGDGIRTARLGSHRKDYGPILERLGFVWTPTMTIGAGCRVHLRADELPSGRIIAKCSRHLVAIIDGVIHDTDPNVDRDGTRCVYGYYSQAAGTD